MMKSFIMAALGVNFLLIASAADAQTYTDRYAACLVQMQPARVRQLLDASSSGIAQRHYDELAQDARCFAKVFGSKPYRPEDAAFSIQMLRGKLAENALLRAQSQVSALAALPLQQKRYSRPWFAATGRNAAVDEMGACMADTDPAGIQALINTAPGSAEESESIASLSTALTKCLSAGTRLEANQGALRAALADALYQRLNHPTLSLADLKGTRR